MKRPTKNKLRLDREVVKQLLHEVPVRELRRVIGGESHTLTGMDDTAIC